MNFFGFLICIILLEICSSFLSQRVQRSQLPSRSSSTGRYEVTVILNGEEKVVSIPKDNNILAGLMDTDLNPPHSCRAGLCTECAAFVEEGMEQIQFEAAILDPKVSKLGFILTCSARVNGPGVKLKLGAGDDMYEAQYGNFVSTTHRERNPIR